MSTIYAAAGSAQTSVSTRRAPNFLKRYFDAYCAWRIRQTLRATLDGLSDLELRDIGVARGEIDYLVRADPSIDPRGF
ncbi:MULTISPECIES: DUF1127 domain-containing protein [unclassified Bradyrhizobium]|uniref:DUF1127 domain-containing protein n=1 Tax=unclassified Bradyrhizobium TaxID=2631580 RepID=UPI0024B07869|nr:DUF1127 domain-containing protein [Bradyrhizobium sp. CB2312]WFU73967.1 DUF1127 domain-containing protein [Bradyrhizobium sp. CB2312]